MRKKVASPTATLEAPLLCPTHHHHDHNHQHQHPLCCCIGFAGSVGQQNPTDFAIQLPPTATTSRARTPAPWKMRFSFPPLHHLSCNDLFSRRLQKCPGLKVWECLKWIRRVDKPTGPTPRRQDKKKYFLWVAGDLADERFVREKCRKCIHCIPPGFFSNLQVQSCWGEWLFLLLFCSHSWFSLRLSGKFSNLTGFS